MIHPRQQGRRQLVAALTLSLTLLAGVIHADPGDADMAELLATVRQLQEQVTQLQQTHDAEISRLQQELETLKAQHPQVDPELERSFAEALDETPSFTAPEADWQDYRRGSAPVSLGNYLDLSVNADILGRLHSNSLRRDRSYLDVRHIELGLSGAVDPYGRFVLYIGMHPGHGHGDDHGPDHDHGPASFPSYRTPAVNTLARSLDRLMNWYWEKKYWHPREHEHDDWELDVEEAYFRFDQLPANLQLRAGKFRASAGKTNIEHLHALPWVDYPLAIQYNFGNEGLSGIGASLSWLVPNPWDHYLLVTYEAFKNDNRAIFAGDQAADLVHLLNVKNFWDIDNRHTVELGLTGAWGPNDGRHGSSATWMQAVDFTYRWRPLDRGKYRSFLWQSEAFFVQKDNRFGDDVNTYGWDTGMEYQFARRWAAGARYDFAQWPDDKRFREHNYQVYTTFRQSEFAYWRLGYRRRDPNFGAKYDDNELFLQLNVELGAHGAHRY